MIELEVIKEFPIAYILSGVGIVLLMIIVYHLMNITEILKKLYKKK